MIGSISPPAFPFTIVLQRAMNCKVVATGLRSRLVVVVVVVVVIDIFVVVVVIVVLVMVFRSPFFKTVILPFVATTPLDR